MRYVVDVSTALRWLGRNAVGIVRTEREIAKSLLQNHKTVELIYFDRESLDFRTLTTDQIRKLFPSHSTKSARKSDGALEINALFLFKDNDILISAGLQWDIDFLSAVYVRKQSKNIKLIQVVYDLIPILLPEYCVPGMDVLFPKFILDTVWTADAVYAISDSTKQDFESYAKSIKANRFPLVRRLKLGCDMPIESTQSPIAEMMEDRRFVLYVSTIEPRKNHKMLFDIWRTMMLENYPNIPTLVFVGSKGWNSDDLLSFLENCPALCPKYIKVLSEVSDNQLQWLYNNAAFTLYPSLYEGWGLPIAESLARGTPCLASNTSSMPEVAGQFCDLLHPLDFVSWKKVIYEYLDNPKALYEKRNKIRLNYKIDTWATAMAEFERDLRDVASGWR